MSSHSGERETHTDGKRERAGLDNIIQILAAGALIIQAMKGGGGGGDSVLVSLNMQQDGVIVRHFDVCLSKNLMAP